MEREKIRWAAKVQPQLIRRVYQSEAAGLLAEDLIDDLGIRLLLRCQSVLRAMVGEVECPRCGLAFNVTAQSAGAGVAVACPSGCGWATTQERFLQSKRHRELNGAESLGRIFGQFVAEYPGCRSPREKLLCIDQLLHAFHWDEKLALPNRSASNNLIEGSHRQVVQFLDDLSAVDSAVKDQWRATVDVMGQRRRGQLPVGRQGLRHQAEVE